jgi:hypothetical protein
MLSKKKKVEWEGWELVLGFLGESAEPAPGQTQEGSRNDQYHQGRKRKPLRHYGHRGIGWHRHLDAQRLVNEVSWGVCGDPGHDASMIRCVVSRSR